MLRKVADHAEKGKNVEKQTGLKKDHPLVRFFGKDGETVENYLALDDALILGSLYAMCNADDSIIANLARRLRERRLYKTLDIADVGHDEGKRRHKRRHIEKTFEEQIENGSVMLDEKASISIYSEIGGDEDRMHKKLHILDGGEPKEISALSPMIKALEKKEQFTRFYFEKEEDRDAARGKKGPSHD
ncbi:hypothetical protein [Phyllobacterium phragmitis]|uniref:HD-associated domain-containing protein n=1 Tax=Phyllobacterium phragmitis TaxID=2670329 RepID=A0ABQ0GWI3_9HYPH